MRRIKMLALMLVLVIGSVTGNTFAASDQVTIDWPGKTLKMDVSPQILDGRTMVPMRALMEALDYEVMWDQEYQTATCFGPHDKTVNIIVGNNIVESAVPFTDKHVTKVTLDVPPTIVDGRILVPIRFLVEMEGLTVTWDAANKVVHINDGTGDYVAAPVEQ